MEAANWHSPPRLNAAHAKVTRGDEVPHFNDPEHWRQRAKEARALAEQMLEPAAKEAMMVVAASYEKVARRAEERIREQRKQ